MEDLLPKQLIQRRVALHNLAPEAIFIQAAGKAISSKNAARIREAWRTLTDLLIEHDWLSGKDLLPLDESDDASGVLAATTPRAEEEAPNRLISAASRFLNTVQMESWNETLRIALRQFGFNFVDLLGAAPDRLAMLSRGKAVDREALVGELIADMEGFLTEHATNSPDPESIDKAWGQASMPYRGDRPFPFYAADRQEEGGDDGTTPIQTSMSRSFKDTVDQLSWKDRLGTTLRVFSYQFLNLCCYGDWDNDEPNETAADKEKATKGLIKDLLEVIQQLRGDFPENSSEMSPYLSLELAAETDSQRVDLQFSIGELVLAEEANEPANLNRHPVKGVLFRVDEASEGIPSVGPGLPLYIPRVVAQECVSQVSGLPLDAHDTLTKHAQEEPTGVMLSASIDGSDFCIEGLLWPWNKADKVAAIKAARGSLGMSMNAAAIGHEVVLNAGTATAQKVFWITKLILLGANILYAAKATYRKTSLAAAEATPEWDLSRFEAEEALAEEEELRGAGSLADITNLVGIAAAEGDPVDSEETTTAYLDDIPGEPTTMMNTQLIEAELSNISTGLGEGLGRLTSDMEALHSTVRTQGEMINELMASMAVLQEERDEAIRALQASSQEQQQQQSQEGLVNLIRETIAEQFNPSGEPRRRTVPVMARAVAQGQNPAAQDPAPTPVALQISNLQGQLQALQGMAGAGAQRLKLLDELRGLQLQQAGAYA